MKILSFCVENMISSKFTLYVMMSTSVTKITHKEKLEHLKGQFCKYQIK